MCQRCPCLLDQKFETQMFRNARMAKHVSNMLAKFELSVDALNSVTQAAFDVCMCKNLAAAHDRVVGCVCLHSTARVH